MNLTAYLANLEKARDRVIADLPAMAKIAATDLAALVKNRVVQRGENADNVPFSPYSTVEVPAFFYKGKSRNSAGAAAVTALGHQGKKLSYKEFRQVNGLKTDKKNFEFTGEMWRGVQVTDVTASGNTASATIQGGSSASKDRLAFGSSHEHISLLKGSAKEVALVQATMQKRFNNTIQLALHGQ